MAIIINIDVMMAKRKMSLGELAERVDITPANLSILKNGKAKAIRFSTLEAICRELDQPGTSSNTVPNRPRKSKKPILIPMPMKRLLMLAAAVFAAGSAMAQFDPMTADTGGQGGPHGQARQRIDLLHPAQRKAQGAGRLLHPAQRGRHPGGGRPAGSGPLPRAHGLQRHEEPPPENSSSSTWRPSA